MEKARGCRYCRRCPSKRGGGELREWANWHAWNLWSHSSNLSERERPPKVTFEYKENNKSHDGEFIREASTAAAECRNHIYARQRSMAKTFFFFFVNTPLIFLFLHPITVLFPLYFPRLLFYINEYFKDVWWAIQNVLASTQEKDETRRVAFEHVRRWHMSLISNAALVY